VEVEPEGARVPVPVVCPTCGADGNAAINAALAQSEAAVATSADKATSTPIPPASTIPRLHLTPSPGSSGTARPRMVYTPGQTDRTQAVYEARAKVLWGDPPRQVAVYLMGQGYRKEEALEIVQEMFKERTSAFRAKGLRYLFVGIGLVCVPILYWLVSLALGYIYVTLFLSTVVAGFCGLTMALKGASMLRSPKSQEGNVAEQ